MRWRRLRLPPVPLWPRRQWLRLPPVPLLLVASLRPLLLLHLPRALRWTRVAARYDVALDLLVVQTLDGRGCLARRRQGDEAAHALLVCLRQDLDLLDEAVHFHEVAHLLLLVDGRQVGDVEGPLLLPGLGHVREARDVVDLLPHALLHTADQLEGGTRCVLDLHVVADLSRMVCLLTRVEVHEGGAGGLLGACWQQVHALNLAIP
mmetsp:Transcript_14853/g.47456  ORF Transcript_14853/g.47456 Transcript_14853/m.47456 type:complete len:206 (-) Transcript_14853:167-784(-)